MAEHIERLNRALVGRYQLERELGRGGMAEVYLAQDLKHERSVALKVLRPELAAVLGTERFLQEIRIAARLNHPHILSLYDSGEVEGFVYYVMPYVAGESLRDRLDRDTQLPIAEAIEIARQVATALTYAHSLGLVHRDIKPENILLEAGQAVLADFGIARAITAAGLDRLTQSGIAVGTPAYMSPEQASGGRNVDGRSDVYSLGCVLYEMLAGEAPFTGPSTQAITARKLAEHVPDLRLVRETVPRPVEAAIKKALAKVPADRFGTAQQFADALVVSEVAQIPPTAATTNRAGSPRSVLARRVDAAGWGLFFVWVGVALIAHLGWGLGLLGIGGITGAVQLARKYVGLGAEPFWLVVGFLFVAGGLAEFLNFEFSLLPFVLIVAGLALLVSALRRRAP